MILTNEIIAKLPHAELANFTWSKDAPWASDVAAKLESVINPDTDIGLASTDIYRVYVRPYISTNTMSMYAHFIILKAVCYDGNVSPEDTWEDTGVCVEYAGSGDIIWEGIRHMSVGDEEDGYMNYPSIADYGKVLISLGEFEEEVINYNERDRNDRLTLLEKPEMLTTHITTSGATNTIELPHRGIELDVRKSLSRVLYEHNGKTYDLDLNRRAGVCMAMRGSDRSWRTNFNQAIDGVRIVYVDETNLEQSTVRYTAIVSAVNPDDTVKLLGVALKYRSDTGEDHEYVDMDLDEGAVFNW